MQPTAVQQKFTAALDALVADVKRDRSVLAAILCGSLSHDVVWDKSDIDLMLVTIDDKKVEESSVPLFAEGVNVHALLIPRTEFRKAVEGTTQNSFLRSLLAKARVLYTHDDTIADLCARLKTIGERDRQVQLLRAAMHVLPLLDKAHKWLITRRDLEYTALWILYAATPLAQIEVIANRGIVDREVIPNAAKLNPELFDTIYVGLLNARKTPQRVKEALDCIDAYVAERARTLFAPILDHLRDVGEVRSARELEDHFRRHHDLTGVTIVCEYLADRGIVGKASAPVHLTKKSNIEVQELAFYHIDERA